MHPQLLLMTTILGLVANAAVIDDRSPSLAKVDERSLQKRATLSTVDLFTSSGCNNYQTTIFTTGNPGGFNGQCFGFGHTVPSVKTTSLYGSCTVTVYTDNSCSNGARAARVGNCLSGSFKSFSTDNC